jgi:hypothetical protein
LLIDFITWDIIIWECRDSRLLADDLSSFVFIFWSRRGASGETLGFPLFIPIQRPIAQQLAEPQPLRLPPVQNRLDDVRRQAGERQEPADICVRDASCSARSVIDLP